MTADPSEGDAEADVEAEVHVFRRWLFNILVGLYVIMSPVWFGNAYEDLWHGNFENVGLDLLLALWGFRVLQCLRREIDSVEAGIAVRRRQAVDGPADPRPHPSCACGSASKAAFLTAENGRLRAAVEADGALLQFARHVGYTLRTSGYIDDAEELARLLRAAETARDPLLRGDTHG